MTREDAMSVSDALLAAWMAGYHDRDQEIARLQSFARRVLRVWPDGDLDGGDLQDAAVEAGLLVQRQVTEIPCGPGCRCVDYYDDADFKAGRHICYERDREALGE